MQERNKLIEPGYRRNIQVKGQLLVFIKLETDEGKNKLQTCRDIYFYLFFFIVINIFYGVLHKRHRPLRTCRDLADATREGAAAIIVRWFLDKLEYGLAQRIAATASEEVRVDARKQGCPVEPDRARPSTTVAARPRGRPPSNDHN